MIRKKKKINYNYNAYYGTEQRIVYSSCKPEEIPLCPTMMELWASIMKQMREEAEQAAKEKEYRDKLTTMRLKNMAKGRKKSV